MTFSQIAAMLSLRASPSAVYHTTIMQPKKRTSTCVKSIDVDPITGSATVTYLTGSSYEYTNVSRRAIANLLTQPQMSLGFWVNKNCKAQGVHVRQIADAYYHRRPKVRVSLPAEIAANV